MQQIPAPDAEGLGHCLQPCDYVHILQGLLTSIHKKFSCQILFLGILKDTSQQKNFWLGTFFFVYFVLPLHLRQINTQEVKMPCRGSRFTTSAKVTISLNKNYTDFLSQGF